MRKRFISNKLHRAVQKKIRQMIDADDVVLEHKFDHRRADILWKSQNIIFEVQCSPISLKEARQRTLDLEQLGYHVKWILHQKSFNKRNLSPAERFLRKQHKAYYTNIDQQGDGSIFDQEEALYHSRRFFKSLPLLVDIQQPKMTLFNHLYFPGDLRSINLKRPHQFKHIWSIKRQILFKRTKIIIRYYYLYLKWKTSII